MKRILMAIIIALAFIGNGLLYAQNKKPVFFGAISCGDNLEECIINGWIQGGVNADDWELVDSNISSYFPESNVEFDSKNIVKEIHLSCSSYDASKTKNDPKGAFNYMLQYFCKRHSRMQQRRIYREVFPCIYDIGTEYHWDTPYISISLKHIQRTHLSEKCTAQPVCFNAFGNCGLFTWVDITKK